MTSTATVDRRSGLGGSDLAAVLGIDRWRSPLDLYLEKVGETESSEETEAMFWGRDLEENVARRWAELEDRKVRRVNTTIVHPVHAWLRCHVDRMVVRGAAGDKEGLEVKVSSADGWGEEGTDQIPEYYLPQPHSYMAVTGASRWHVAALLWSWGPPQLRRYVVERDEEMIAIILSEGERYWREHVLARVPPDPKTSEQANRRWGRVAAGKCVAATGEVLRAIDDLEAVKAEQKQLEGRRDELELAIKQFLQDGEAIVEGGQVRATWKAQTSRRFDVTRFKAEHAELAEEYHSESTYRVLRIPSRRGKGRAKQSEEEA